MNIKPKKMRPLFEDPIYEENEERNASQAWARICKKHVNLLGIKECDLDEYPGPSEVKCDIRGCRNQAAYYLTIAEWR